MRQSAAVSIVVVPARAYGKAATAGTATATATALQYCAPSRHENAINMVLYKNNQKQPIKHIYTIKNNCGAIIHSRAYVDKTDDGIAQNRQDKTGKATRTRGAWQAKQDGNKGETDKEERNIQRMDSNTTHHGPIMVHNGPNLATRWGR